jgi:hypothetical protein
MDDDFTTNAGFKVRTIERGIVEITRPNEDKPSLILASWGDVIEDYVNALDQLCEDREEI